MVVDQGHVGRLQGLLTQPPVAHLLEHVHRDPFGTVAHGRDAEIRAVRDQRGQQGRGQMSRAGLVFPQGLERAREPAPRVYLREHLFDADARQMGLEHAPQFPNAVGDVQRVRPFQAETPIPDGGKAILRHPLGGTLRQGIEFLLEALQRCLGLAGESQLSIGPATFLVPARFLV